MYDLNMYCKITHQCKTNGTTTFLKKLSKREQVRRNLQNVSLPRFSVEFSRIWCILAIQHLKLYSLVLLQWK